LNQWNSFQFFFLNIFLVCPIRLPLFSLFSGLCNSLHPSSIRCRGSNPRPLDREPSALTTRPSFSTDSFQFCHHNDFSFDLFHLTNVIFLVRRPRDDSSGSGPKLYAEVDGRGGQDASGKNIRNHFLPGKQVTFNNV
jgi:hypothetical protein